MTTIYRMPTRTPADPEATVRADVPLRLLSVGDDFPEPHMNGADPLGEDCAERHSAWGHLPDCAAEGGQFREPSGTVRPGLLARLLRRLGF